MIKDIAQELLPIILVMLLVLCATVWVLIKTPINTFFKLVLIPSAVIASAAIPLMFTTLIGHSVKLPLPDQFQLLAHRVVVVNSKKSAIEIWLKEKGENKTRLYITPYSKELEAKLEEGKVGQLQGEQIMMKRGKSSDYGIELHSPRRQHLKQLN